MSLPVPPPPVSYQEPQVEHVYPDESKAGTSPVINAPPVITAPPIIMPPPP